MSQITFPPLALADWQPTRDTIQVYAKLLSKIRRVASPAQKHWWHISLCATATGLTTTPMFAGGKTFELSLDFTTHHLRAATSQGERAVIPLNGQSAAQFCHETLAALAGFGIEPEIDQGLFADETPGTYAETAVSRFWQALSQVDAIFKEFKAGLRQESSPVQLWPHHFDLALLWLSGRLVPGQDAENAEYADEQMNFGFSTGDAGISNPYFYATAYPTPDGLTQAPLPSGAYWQTTGWTGAIMMYESLETAVNPPGALLTFLRTSHQAGANLMGR